MGQSAPLTVCTLIDCHLKSFSCNTDSRLSMYMEGQPSPQAFTESQELRSESQCFCVDMIGVYKGELDRKMTVE